DGDDLAAGEHEVGGGRLLAVDHGRRARDRGNDTEQQRLENQASHENLPRRERAAIEIRPSRSKRRRDYRSDRVRVKPWPSERVPSSTVRANTETRHAHNAEPRLVIDHLSARYSRVRTPRGARLID